jgi:UMF1 family MFS transporter
MIARARAAPDLGRFLVGRIFYSDAATTMLAFMSIYVTKEVGFSETGAQIVLIAGILGGFAGAFYWGPVVDRLGPKRALNRVLALWVVLFAAIVAIAYLGLPGWLFWPLAPFAGVALSGLSVADRPYMLRLTPPRHLGQLYVLYAMVGRFAAILGPLVWATIVDVLGWGRPAAIVSLLVMVLVSIVLLRPVRDTPRDWLADAAVPRSELAGPPA